jgi:hypothetical protein
MLILFTGHTTDFNNLSKCGWVWKEGGLGTIIIIIIIIITRHLNFNALWLVAQEGRRFEATLGMDKRDGSPTPGAHPLVGKGMWGEGGMITLS